MAKYSFGLPRNPASACSGAPNCGTLVFLVRLDSLKMADLEAIPLSPRTGSSAVPTAVKDIVEHRLGNHGLIWLAGDLSHVDALKELLPFAPISAGLCNC